MCATKSHKPRVLVRLTRSLKLTNKTSSATCIEITHFVGLKFYVIHNCSSPRPHTYNVLSSLKFKSSSNNQASLSSLRSIMLVVRSLTTNSLSILYFISLDNSSSPFWIPASPKSNFFHLSNLVVTLIVYLYK